MKKIVFVFLSIIFSLAAFAQRTEKEIVKMADTMRSNGRIYVVVAVIVTIFVGLILYLIRLDRKITRWEKQEQIND